MFTGGRGVLTHGHLEAITNRGSDAFFSPARRFFCPGHGQADAAGLRLQGQQQRPQAGVRTFRRNLSGSVSLLTCARNGDLEAESQHLSFSLG